MAKSAGGTLPIALCGRAVLYNTATEHPQEITDLILRAAGAM